MICILKPFSISLSPRLTFILKSINYSYNHTKFDYIITYTVNFGLFGLLIKCYRQWLYYEKKLLYTHVYLIIYTYCCRLQQYKIPMEGTIKFKIIFHCCTFVRLNLNPGDNVCEVICMIKKTPKQKETCLFSEGPCDLVCEKIICTINWQH